MDAVWPASRRVGEKVAREGLLVALLLVGNGWPELAVEMGVNPRRVNWRAEEACQGDCCCWALVLRAPWADGWLLVWLVVLLKEVSWEEGGGRPLIDTARTLGSRVWWVMGGWCGSG